MDLESLGSLPVGSLWWRLGDNPWTLTVVCKGTLDLTPGELRLSARQDPIVSTEQHMGASPQASLYLPTDILPYKPRSEIALVGWAYAPGGAPAESIVVRLSVGRLDKSIRVVGDETLGGGRQPFVSAPLSHELAAGGPGTLNPVGRTASPAGPLPRLLPMGPAARAHAEPALAALGPIRADWPSRRRLLHGKAAPALPASGGELCLPGDFDLRFFNAAPPDQQLEELSPGATLLLENLHPSHPVLHTRLPRMSPQLFVLRKDGERFERAAAMDTVWIDTQRLVATVTWRVVLELGPRSDYEKAWVVITEASKRLSWNKLAKLIGSGGGLELGGLSLGSTAARSGSASAQREETGGSDAASEGPRSAPWPARQSALDYGGEREPAVDSQGSETLAITDRGSKLAREEDTQTEVTASVLFDRVQLGNGAASPSSGIPSWLASSGPSARPQQAPNGQPIPPPTTPPPPPAVLRPSSAASHGPVAPAVRPVIPAGAPPVAVNGAAPPAVPAAVGGPLGVRPPQPSWMAAGGIHAEPRKPWEDTSSFPRVVSSLPRPTPRAAQRRDVVELLWLEPSATRRLRQCWPHIAEELDFAPIDPRHDLPSDDPHAARERHTHFGILTEAPLTDTHELGAIVRESVSDSGRFTPPLVVLAGRIQFPFDELEILRATAAALTPIAGDDKKLKESLGNVKELLDSPILQHSNELIDNFVKHLRQLYDGSKRALARDYLDTSVERMLLEQRRYQKRSLFDGSWIRALLSPATSGEAIPTYLPDALDKTLPMMVAFRARLLAEVHVKQDQYESHPHSLRVVTLGRVLDVDR